MVNDSTKSVALEYQGLLYAKQLVNTYIEILKTSSFREKVSKYSGKFTPGQVGGMISFATVPETQLFKINITTTSIEDSYEIANIILTAAPDTLYEIIGADTLKVVSKPVKAGGAVNNSTNRNTLVGAFVGAVVTAGIVLLLGILDTRVKNEEDLRTHYNVPILGGIVNFDKVYKGKSHQ